MQFGATKTRAEAYFHRVEKSGGVARRCGQEVVLREVMKTLLCRKDACHSQETGLDLLGVTWLSWGLD